MFKSISHLRCKNSKYYYQLVDSDFTCEVSATRPHSMRPAAIVMEYQKRNLSVPRNLALWYLSQKMQNTENRLNYDRDRIDRYYSELEYGKRYYEEIKHNYYKLLILQ